VTLYNGKGNPAGDGTQTTTLNPDGSWAIDYRFSGKTPHGRFTVEAIVQDQVGNQSAANSSNQVNSLMMTSSNLTTSSLLMDEQAAQPEINLWNMPDTITETMVLSGTVIDQIDPSGAIVQYHFEEAAGATIFYDSSYEGNHGLCSNCPTAGITGQYGQAVQFNGGTQAISITTGLNPISTTFSVATWLNADNFNNAQTLLSQQSGTGIGHEWLRLNTNGQLKSLLGGAVVTTTTSLTAGQWHHVVLTYDGTTLRLYIDAALEATVLQPMTSADGDLIIGISQDLSTAPFSGLLDEFMLFDYALAEGEIEALAESDVIGVEGVDIWFEPFTFTNTVSTPAWEDTTLLGTAGDTLASWEYALPKDLEGFYRLNLRAADLFGNSSGMSTIWNGIIDTAAPQINFEASIIGFGLISDYEYTFTISDFVLDETSVVHPCDNRDITYHYYDLPSQPHDGLLYEVSGTCRIHTETADESSSPFVTVGACDGFGHCSEETKQATSIGKSALIIYAPENRSEAPLASPFTISGGIAGVEDYALNMTVTVNNMVVGSFVPLNTSFGDWSTDLWMPTALGTYTITVEADMASQLPLSDTVIVTLTEAPNTAPVAVDDQISTPEDQAVIISLLANDTDAEGDSLTVDSVGTPLYGTVINNGIDVTYQPLPHFNGTDVFTYTVSDGLLLSRGVVSITVTAVNDPPQAVDDAATTNEDQAVVINVLLNDSDIENDPLQIDSISQPLSGTTAISGTEEVLYTPAADFNGVITFTYTLTDGTDISTPALVTVTVNAVNDAPIAIADTAVTDEDTPIILDLLANDSDVDSPSLIIDSVTQPTNGVVSHDGQTAIYTPTANFNGNDSFSYLITDGAGGSSTSVVTITVNPINDAPNALDDETLTAEDTPITIDVLANDSDVDGDILTITAVGSTTNGSLLNNGNSVTFTPALNFYGTVVFTYTVSDGLNLYSTAQVTVTISSGNDNPIGVADQATMAEDTTAVINVLANDSDIDGDILSITSITAPAHGVAVISDSMVIYTPTANYYGADSFVYTVSDGNGGGDSAVVDITITPVNDTPQLGVEAGPALANETEVAVKMGTVSDEDGDTLTLNASIGTVTVDINNNWTWNYTTGDGPADSQTITITAEDGQGGSTQITFDLIVRNIAPPISEITSSGTLILGESSTITVTASDPIDPILHAFDCDNDGTFEVGPQVSAQANCNFDSVGTFTVGVEVRDDDGGVATGSIAITVISHQQAIAELRTVVEALKTAGVLNTGQTKSLSKNLDNAVKKLDKGQQTNAITHLDAFVTKVNEFIADGVLTFEQGQLLIDAAQRIRTAITATS
ncbi:MAG: tandem-95 repeat protein, partial [Anaerolineales bacterium]|nr:tandem-95 repeat protein [Anaerolineales bacterium]